ncbi:MAG: FAD-dependent oxidoreductase [Tardiphaga sp.]|uniref:FAD-dependent oxidoreductase n=1 Tax=Tardiphaga sp. TaxID=1926292 RepID=UPI002619922B|nr:FAD-dependent oxidoreductase [Tardiphaga sp.]MDB5503767.1 FAD-dependent oxidoreductase [Tardiphaga sp.]
MVSYDRALVLDSVANGSVVEQLSTTVAAEYDVIVAGGGAAGLVAAVTAARHGARTLLVERQGCLGGTATTGYVAQYIGFFNHGIQAVWGLPFEFTQRIVAAGGSEGFTKYMLAEASANPVPIHNFPFNPEIVKWVADEWAEEAGVEVALHANVTAVLKDGDRVGGVIVEDVAGRRAYRARVVVDASGDATPSYLAGVTMRAPEDEGQHGGRQPQSLVFRLSNIDVARFRAIPRDTKRALALEGVRRGEIFWESLSFMSTPGGVDAICLMSRILNIDPLDPRQASSAERIGRQQVKSIIGFLKREVPGFENAVLASIAPRIGVRETRRIIGDYTLTEHDILSGVTFPDSIALGCGPMDIHDAQGTGIKLFVPPGPFEIPMRCLIPVGVEGLIVTGRTISATRAANGGARHMATAMALGQAAGSMAVVACRDANAVHSIPAAIVKSLLEADGALTTRDACLARAARAPESMGLQSTPMPSV